MKKTTIQCFFVSVVMLGSVLIPILVKPMLAKIISYFVWWFMVWVVGWYILDD